MARMTGSRRVRLVVCAGGVVGLVGLLIAGGCGKGDRWWKDNNEPVTDSGESGSEVDTSLTALSGEGDQIDPIEAVDSGEGFGSTRDQVVESARMMDEYFSGMAAGEELDEAVVIDDSADVEPAADPALDPALDLGGEEVANEVAGDGMGDGSFSLTTALAERDELEEESAGMDAETDGGGEVAAELPVEVVEVDAEQRKEELVAELVDVLTGLARTSENPGAAAAALAGMDSMSVEVLEGLHGEGVLSDSELSTLRAAREVLDSISSSGDIASPADVAEVLDRVKDELDRASGIRVVRGLLCTRVDGFGRYEPFASNEFVAGVAQEVIVYVEVDRFGHRELTGNDGQARYEVEMSQRLELYHVADDLNTWNRAAEVDVSVSRNKVRDYYLINKITLPRNLGVGRYHLKVVMRDLVEGKVGELIIPIRMVVR